MKRKLTLLLSAVMATSSLPMTAYAATFKDIDTVAWAKTAIANAADRGLVSGYEDNTFRAGSNVTYCEAMTMVYQILQKTGTAAYMDAATTYSYMQTLTQLNVPKWCQVAVAYGLENNLIDMQMVISKFVNSSTKATREDVAKIFGKAMAVRYGYERETTAAAEFADYWNISAEAVAQVDLLKRLGIVSGNENNFFAPKNNITRAEMAVMLNNTYEVLTEGVGNTGTVKSVTQNAGEYFYFEIEMDNGYTEGFHAKASGVKVYAGNTDQEMALSRISKGDKVSVVYNGGALSVIRVLDAVPSQQKYDLTGYITSMKDSVLDLDNENTGESTKYNIDSDCICYLDGVKITRKNLEKAIKENSDKYAYAGIMTEFKKEKVTDSKGNSSREDVEYVIELHVEFTEGYTTAGKLDSITDKLVSFNPDGGTAEQQVFFAKDCEFYIGDSRETLADLKKMADGGTVYVKVSVNAKNEATKVIMSEDSFDSGSTSKMEYKTVKVTDLTDDRIVVESSGKKYTYKFGSDNPLKNITFYTWDSDDKDWDSVKVEKAAEYFDEYDEDDKTVYCRLEFNSGGKLSAIEISNKKSAWSSNDDQTERKGTVASLENGVLKFKTASTSYTMLSKYNVKYDSVRDDSAVTGTDADGNTVKNPLVIESVVTSSLSVFEKLANDSNVDLYAEIVADSDNKVQKIDARVEKAVGELVEYDKSDKIIKIETADGNTYRFKTTSSPKLTDEDDDFTLEDIESHGYVGSELELGFNSNGMVNKITVTDSAYNDGVSRLKGIATAAYDGLKVEGEKGTYRWQTRSYLTISNRSSNSTDIDRLKDMIEDEDVTVYVEASLGDQDSPKVERITVYVREASGTLVAYDDDDNVIRIKTDAGNTFSFYVKNKPDCDVGGIDYKKLADKGVGKEIQLTFNDDGIVSKIRG